MMNLLIEQSRDKLTNRVIGWDIATEYPLDTIAIASIWATVEASITISIQVTRVSEKIEISKLQYD